MPRQKLSKPEVEQALTELPGWQILDGKLHKTFKFKSFAQAMGWMVSVAIYADKLDHHPEWSNIYSRVTVDLVTHDLGNAISNLDVELARRMEALTAKE
jgi:4a-hydroxytetrahydrobiopterin dehydratase